MAFIRCPECGKELSDRAPVCIHCGYPLQEAAPSDPTQPLRYRVVIPCCKDQKSLIKAVRIIRKVTGCGLADAKALAERQSSVVADEPDREKAKQIAARFIKAGIAARVIGPDAEAVFIDQTLRCPQCGSASVAAMDRGLFTVGIGKPVHVCQLCGYRFK